jgi:hypothetical protein
MWEKKSDIGKSLIPEIQRNFSSGFSSKKNSHTKNEETYSSNSNIFLILRISHVVNL